MKISKMKVVVYRTEHPIGTANEIFRLLGQTHTPREKVKWIKDLSELKRGDAPLPVLHTTDMSLAQYFQDNLRESGAVVSVVEDG